MGTQIIHFLSLFVSELHFILRLAIPYLALFIAFLLFFVRNGYSVVLGDRENHSISLHFMQICYFSVFFCTVFIDDIVFKCYQAMRNPSALFTRWNLICYLLCLFFSGMFCFSLDFIVDVFTNLQSFIHSFLQTIVTLYSTFSRTSWLSLLLTLHHCSHSNTCWFLCMPHHCCACWKSFLLAYRHFSFWSLEFYLDVLLWLLR